ncbi:AI-2E family transporter [Candidatus Woesearchaeota archaeon]|nr:AI-2E family transporter [Candidatus Woesearchaeota archaeon]
MARELKYKPYFFLTILALVIVLSFLVVKPFLVSILTAGVLAYIAYPLYQFLARKLSSKNVAASIVIVLLILVILSPILIILGSLPTAFDGVRALQDVLRDTSLKDTCDAKASMLCSVYEHTLLLLNDPEVNAAIGAVPEKIFIGIFSATSNIITALPVFFLNLFIMFFFTFYLLRDGDRFIKHVLPLIPLKGSHKRNILNKFSEVTYAVLYGHVFIALIQAIVAVIGYYLFGFKALVLLGALTFVCALIPVLGTFIVWGPLALTRILSGMAVDNQSIVAQGIGLLLWGMLVSVIDNILKPKIIGDRTNVHPAVILIGLIGGLMFFGMAGVVLGPLVLALLIVVLEIYRKEKHAL